MARFEVQDFFEILKKQKLSIKSKRYPITPNTPHPLRLADPSPSTMERGQQARTGRVGGDGVSGVRRVMKLIVIESVGKKGCKELKLEGG